MKLVEKGGAPWLTIENGHLTEESKRQADEMYLKLGGRVFFQNVAPLGPSSPSAALLIAKVSQSCPHRGEWIQRSDGKS